jgi:hypothetical protein
MRLRADNRVEAPTMTRFDGRLDALARSLAEPMPRRRALTVFGLGLVAASAPGWLRPPAARAVATCGSDGPNCTSGGSPCCVDVKGGFRVPLGGCTCPGDNRNPNAKCCQGACNDGSATVWCCDVSERCGQGPRNCADVNPAPSEPNCVCDTVPASFGRRAGLLGVAAQTGSCCPPAQVCGSNCCKPNEECVVDPGLIFDSKECKPKCPGFGQKRCPAGHCCDKKATCCPNGCCNPPLECAGDSCRCPGTGQLVCGVSADKPTCCKEGEVCINRRCTTPPKTPGLIDSLMNGFSGYGDTVSQTGARGGKHLNRYARLAAVPAEVDAALLQLGAVEALYGTAIASFADLHKDKTYLRKVAAPKPSLPPLAAGPALPPQAVSALNGLLAAEAKAFALMLAAATSVARARGALSKKDMKRATGHVSTAGSFASQASKALKPLPAMRANVANTLRAALVAEVNSRIADEVTFQDGLRNTGIPADLRALLARLGVTGDDLVRTRKGLTGAPTTGGAALIAPLADPQRSKNLQALATALSRYATDAKRKPISFSNGGPAQRPLIKGKF